MVIMRYNNYKKADLGKHLKKHWWKYLLGAGAIGLAGYGLHATVGKAISSLREDISKMQSQIDASHKMHQESDKHRKELHGLIMQHTDKIKKLEKQRETLEEKIDKTNKEFEEYKKRHEETAKNMEDLKKTIEEAHSKIDITKKEIHEKIDKTISETEDKFEKKFNIFKDYAYENIRSKVFEKLNEFFNALGINKETISEMKETMEKIQKRQDKMEENQGNFLSTVLGLGKIMKTTQSGLLVPQKPLHERILEKGKDITKSITTSLQKELTNFMQSTKQMAQNVVQKLIPKGKKEGPKKEEPVKEEPVKEEPRIEERPTSSLIVIPDTSTMQKLQKYESYGDEYVRKMIKENVIPALISPQKQKIRTTQGGIILP